MKSVKVLSRPGHLSLRSGWNWGNFRTEEALWVRGESSAAPDSTPSQEKPSVMNTPEVKALRKRGCTVSSLKYPLLCATVMTDSGLPILPEIHSNLLNKQHAYTVLLLHNATDVSCRILVHKRAEMLENIVHLQKEASCLDCSWNIRIYKLLTVCSFYLRGFIKAGSNGFHSIKSDIENRPTGPIHGRISALWASEPPSTVYCHLVDGNGNMTSSDRMSNMNFLLFLFRQC